MNELEQGRWLTLAEIASRTGRHIDAVRSWAYRGRRSERLRTQKNNRHELQVWFTPELVPELAQGLALATSFLGSGSDEGANEVAAELRSRVEDLTEALTEARIRQARAEGELAAEARRSTDLVVALEREREERAKMSAELAEARKGWLERLLEAVRRK